jgi:dihydropyrimidinase
VVSTDHCAFRFSDQKTLGVNDFSKIPNGGPGIENRLSLIYTNGVVSGLMDMNRLVEVFATTPAKLFGLFPRKGTIAVGSDADIVVFDPDAETVISAQTHHMNIDYNLYEGMTVKGVPEAVIANGRVLVEGGKYTGISAGGRFLKRSPQ